MNVMAKRAMAEGAYLFFILVCLAEKVQNLCIVYNPLRDTSDNPWVAILDPDQTSYLDLHQSILY